MIISYMLIRNHFIRSATHISKQVEWIPHGEDKKTIISLQCSLKNLPYNQDVIRKKLGLTKYT